MSVSAQNMTNEKTESTSNDQTDSDENRSTIAALISDDLDTSESSSLAEIHGANSANHHTQSVSTPLI